MGWQFPTTASAWTRLLLASLALSGLCAGVGLFLWGILGSAGDAAGAVAFRSVFAVAAAATLLEIAAITVLTAWRLEFGTAEECFD